MIYNDAQEHFRWIGIITDRIICAKKQENELPLLSLSFLDDNHDLTKYSNLQRPSFPIKIEDLSNAKLYGIIVSAISSNQKSDSLEKQMDFDSILSDLSNEGYKPQKPCDTSGLNDGILEHHVNLCRSIEFLVVDRSLNINMLASDLRRLPRSFFVLKSDMQLDLLEDAVSLWLSKFHCNANFNKEKCVINNEEFKSISCNLSEKNYKIQIDASNFAKVAACLARIFPKQINKNEIKQGNSEEDILNNKNLSKIILDELHAFVIEKFPTDEHLFMLFISDLFYATRSGVKKFVKLDQPPPLQKVHSLPQPILQLNNNDLSRPKTASALTTSKSIYPEKEIKIAHSPSPIKQNPTKPPQNQQKPKITKPKVEPKKEKEKIQKKIEKNSQPQKNSKNAKSNPSTNKKGKPKPQSNKKEPLNEDKINDLPPQNESIQKVDSNGSIEKLNEEEDSNNQQNNEINEKPKPRRYILEFPEIEILLSRIIQKFPQNEIYYRNIYDIFMQVMQDATIINSPNISEIFTVSKAAFNQLLEKQDKLEFDFEQKLRSLLNKSSSNKEDENEHPQKANASDNNDNCNNENTDHNSDKDCDETEKDDQIRSNRYANNDACDDIADDLASKESNFNASNADDENSTSDNKIYDSRNDEKENSNQNENCSNYNDNVNEKYSNTDDNENDNENENCSNNNGNANDYLIEKYGNKSGHKNDTNPLNFDSNRSDDDENEISNYYNGTDNLANNSGFNDDDDGIDTHGNDPNNYGTDANAGLNEYGNSNNNDDDVNHDSSNDKRNDMRVTFTLPDNFNHKPRRSTQNADSFEFEDEEENFTENLEFSLTNENDANQEEANEEEMTDEMILREAEKISSQKFNSKLKRLSSSNKPKSTSLKKASTVPNHQTILNALRFNSLPSPKYKKLLDSITELLKDFKDERILLLMASRTQKFKGIYVLSGEGDSAEKLWGNGPNEIQNENVNNFFKYINGQKSFEIITSKSFTQTTDGFSLKKQFESDSW